jgi:nitric oxide dioxygenase
MPNIRIASRVRGEYMALPVEMLERSFDLVAPRGEDLVNHLYANIFARAPSALSLFSETDMTRQKKMVLQILIMLRKSLRNLDAIVPALQSLGVRHARYGVLPEHYPVVGSALLEAMATVGGDEWKPAYTAAWADAYGVVRDVMLSGVSLGTDAAR